MPSIFKTVLSEIGWDSRFAIPDIIDENKILFAEVSGCQCEAQHELFWLECIPFFVSSNKSTMYKCEW